MTTSPTLLLERKRAGRPIVVLTAYDAPTAAAEQAAGIDVILVGDSVGTNILGYASEREVTLADIAHHVGAVRRGAPEAFVLADLPAGTYETIAAAQANAAALRRAGADAVKLEGPRLDVIAALAGGGIPVCGHIGLEPQHHDHIAIKGKHAAEALRILDDARSIAQSGAFLIVLELIPEELAGLVTRTIAIPTIGIGAGRETDGQVLVVNDMLGLTPRSFRHNRRFQALGPSVAAGLRSFRDAVERRDFPGPENATHMPADELAALHAALAGRPGAAVGPLTTAPATRSGRD
jgi:3-methyl-2-oxobutanoate hydroxymethyltransferase